jgi:hypothetical protein
MRHPVKNLQFLHGLHGALYQVIYPRSFTQGLELPGLLSGQAQSLTWRQVKQNYIPGLFWIKWLWHMGLPSGIF